MVVRGKPLSLDFVTLCIKLNRRREQKPDLSPESTARTLWWSLLGPRSLSPSPCLRPPATPSSHPMTACVPRGVYGPVGWVRDRAAQPLPPSAPRAPALAGRCRIDPWHALRFCPVRTRPAWKDEVPPRDRPWWRQSPRMEAGKLGHDGELRGGAGGTHTARGAPGPQQTVRGTGCRAWRARC